MKSFVLETWSMSHVPFDTLKLATALREKAHFTPEQAEGITQALSDAFEERIATKDDISGLKHGIDEEISNFRHAVEEEFSNFRHAVDEEFSKVKHDIERLDSKIGQVDAKFEAKLEALELRLTIKLGTIVVVAIGAVAAIVKFIHV
jgi:predicted  nucleic acid-binding Zn-ribbon protein